MPLRLKNGEPQAHPEINIAKLGDPIGDNPAPGTGTGIGVSRTPDPIGTPASPLPPPGTLGEGGEAGGGTGGSTVSGPSSPGNPHSPVNSPPAGSGSGTFPALPPGSTQGAGNFGVDNPNTANATALATAQDAGLYTVGASLITNYQNGTLPPGMMNYINEQTQEQINTLTQQFDSMGIGTDNTEYTSAVAQIQDNAAGVVAQQLNQEYANGMQAFGLDNSMLQYVENANVANTYASAQNNATQAAMISSIFGSLTDIFP